MEIQNHLNINYLEMFHYPNGRKESVLNILTSRNNPITLTPIRYKLIKHRFFYLFEITYSLQILINSMLTAFLGELKMNLLKVYEITINKRLSSIYLPKSAK